MERCEYKFPLSREDYEALLPIVESKIPPDKNGRGKPYTISSMYFDDTQHKLYYQTFDRAAYRYKLRLRVYGNETTDETMSFFEIKSKHLGRSDKKRLALPLEQNERVWREGYSPNEIAAQIVRRIKTDCLQPSAIVSYERLAFAAEGEERLRVTFDSNLRIRTDDLDLRHGTHGTMVMNDCFCVMEIKSGSNLPLWLVRAVSERGLGNKSYSKYGHTIFNKGEQS